MRLVTETMAPFNEDAPLLDAKASGAERAFTDSVFGRTYRDADRRYHLVHLRNRNLRPT